MGIMLEAGYHLGSQGNYTSVPAPYDGDPTIPTFWNYLASQAHQMAGDAISAVLIPPPLKAQGGTGKGCDGYGQYDDFDPGNKDQQFSKPTRFGPLEDLLRMAAIFDANGIDLYADIILHQRCGGSADGTYKYVGSDGRTPNGRFAKKPSYFFGTIPPRVSRDPIAGPVSDDFSFGDELCPINAKPHDELAKGLISAGDWLTNLLHLKGYRIDDTKGLAVPFVRRYLTSAAMANKFAVGEYYDGNPDTLNWWVWNSGMQGRCATFDFALRWPLQRMCNNNSRWDMRQLVNAGLISKSPFQAVTFLENHDTDLSFPCIWNKLLGYAAMSTLPGYPCLFGRDYFQRKDCYGLRPFLSNTNWIHEHLANGDLIWRQTDYQFVVFERTGYGVPGLLVGLNNDQYSWQTTTVDTNFGANVQLHDYSGHCGDLWTNGNGRVTLSIPPNSNGHSYVAYSRLGQDKPNHINKRSTTQHFEGAEDLGIGPAVPNTDVSVTRLYIEEESHFEVKRIHAPNELSFHLLDPNGRTVTNKANRTGWYSLHVRSSGSSPQPFQVAVTYQAPQTINLQSEPASPHVHHVVPQNAEHQAAFEMMQNRVELRRRSLARIDEGL